MFRSGKAQWRNHSKRVDGKQPYRFGLVDGSALLLAGIYERNLHARETTFTVLTTLADASLAEFHDRKPIVLSAQIASQWMKLQYQEI